MPARSPAVYQAAIPTSDTHRELGHDLGEQLKVADELVQHPMSIVPLGAGAAATHTTSRPAARYAAWSTWLSATTGYARLRQYAISSVCAACRWVEAVDR